MGKEALTALEKFQAAMPGREKFTITPMPADTSTEVGVQIDTGIIAGTGWQIYGIDWGFRQILTPFNVMPGYSLNADRSYQLQLCRGLLPAVPIMLGKHDPDLVMEDTFFFAIASAVGVVPFAGTRKFREQDVTTQQDLYVMFGTSVDDPDIAATYEIRGEILYDLVPSKDVGQGKGGDLSKL